MSPRFMTATRGACPPLLSFLAVVMAQPLTAQANTRLYQQACDDGDFFACNLFGLMLEVGDGVLQDVGRAAGLYRRACEGGEMSGCTNLGLLYAAGAGVAQDSARGRGLLRVACEGGQTLACEQVGPLEQAAAGELTGGFNKVGRVRDRENGRTLAEAIVDLPELEVRAISDETGRLEFLGLPPGRHALTAQRSGYVVLEAELEVLDDGEFAVDLTRSADVDPSATSRILGRVGEGTAPALPGVEISVVGQPAARTLSDAQGRFTLRSVAPGLVEVRFILLGYAPRTATLIAQPGGTTEITAIMATQPIELEPIEVTVRPLFLERSGYYERSSLGTQFSRSEIETIAPIVLSDLLRRVPGVESIGAVPVGRRYSNLSGRPCAIPLYVDGIHSADPSLNRFRPEEIEAVEVYQGLSTPIEYGNACGAVLIWTRRGG